MSPSIPKRGRSAFSRHKANGRSSAMLMRLSTRAKSRTDTRRRGVLQWTSEPMLARSGRLPLTGDYAYEAKWDGFRAIVSTEGPLRVRSRRGWDMTPHVGFLAELPVRAVLDGELVALDDDGRPDFPLICECLLQRRFTIPLTYMVFDVLSVQGENMASQPYAQRRLVLEELQLNGRQWRTPEGFDDGEALWEAVCEHELEGVVAKPGRSRPLRIGRARLGEDQEPRLLALRDGG